MTLVVDFCGERTEVDPTQPFCVGREGDLVLDDNPFLHRRFLLLEKQGGLWWIGNVGGQLSATLTEPHGLLQSWLSPGARLPLTLPQTVVSFTAGATSYELELLLENAPYSEMGEARELVEHGQTTVGRVTFSPDQLLLVLVLAEPRLRADSRATSVLPTASQAAERLGWTVTKFNRKLDNVCAKLAALGVRGLHGDPDRLAANRRARLVEYAVGARLVTREDLAALPGVSDG